MQPFKLTSEAPALMLSQPEPHFVRYSVQHLLVLAEPTTFRWHKAPINHSLSLKQKVPIHGRYHCAARPRTVPPPRPIHPTVISLRSQPDTTLVRGMGTRPARTNRCHHGKHHVSEDGPRVALTTRIRHGRGWLQHTHAAASVQAYEAVLPAAPVPCRAERERRCRWSPRQRPAPRAPRSHVPPSGSPGR